MNLEGKSQNNSDLRDARSAMRPTEQGWVVLDRDQYPADEISDEEFAKFFGERTPVMLVPSEVPPREGVRIVFSPQ
jgi:hypothetical protein